MFRALGSFIKNQPIRFFALVCVAITSAYVMWVGYWLAKTLTAPDWCNRTLAANKIAVGDGGFDVLQACVGLLGQQLKATALNSHILFGTIALCLLALMVIVVAGGQLSFSGPGGFGGSVGGNSTPAKAAERVAVAAEEKAEEIAEEEQ